MLVLISYRFYFLVWIVLAPLLYIAFLKDYKKTLIMSIVYGIITYILSSTWVNYSEFDYLDIISFVTIFTLYFVLFFTIVAFLSKKIKNMFVVLLPPVIWIILMFVYSFLPIQIYWMDFAIFYPYMAPLIWYIGSYGITFFIILFNSTLAYYFIKKTKHIITFLFFLVIIIVVCFFYSNTNFTKDGEKLRIALLQGNFPYEWEWRQFNAFGIILDTYLNMTFEASKENPNVIIWPEYSLPEDITKNKIILRKLQKTADSLNVTLILGSLSYIDSNKEKYKDTAFIFTPQGSVQIYESILPYFFDSGVVKGDVSDVLEYNNGKFGVLICNEEITQSIARAHSNEDSQFIVSMSNNQDLGRGRYIISQFTKLRAAENAKYLVRATNDGITQIVNPFGKVVASLEPQKRKILIGEIYVNNYKTFYTKYGNILIYLVMILSVVLMLKKR